MRKIYCDRCGYVIKSEEDVGTIHITIAKSMSLPYSIQMSQRQFVYELCPSCTNHFKNDINPPTQE